MSGCRFGLYRDEMGGLKQLPQISIYTDGSCSPNPGPGGWSAVLLRGEDSGTPETLQGGEADTTNNRMELTAALKALQTLAEPHAVSLFTDSKYLQEGITAWVANWQRRGWTTIVGEAVKNRDLWQDLVKEIARHEVSWHWVKGHRNNRWNELADTLAGAVQSRAVLPVNDPHAIHIYLGITWSQKTNTGSWAAVFEYRQHRKIAGQMITGGTANSLHITSAQQSLDQLKRPLPVRMYTTSGYLKDGATRWLKQWQQRNWQTADGKEVSNRSQWQALASLLQNHEVSFHLVDKKTPPCHLQEAKEIAREFLD